MSFKGFQYKPPTPEPVPQKWVRNYLLAYKNTLGTNLFQVYPEEDWGLMSKFSSQKEIYDEIFEKQVLFDILSKLLKNLFLAISFKSNAIKIVYSVVIILETLS